MKKEFTIFVFTENRTGLLNRVTIIFTRRQLNIQSITVSGSETEGVSRYTIVVEAEEDLVKKVVAQLEKQVDIIKAFYHKEEDIVYQEIALYKVPIEVLTNGKAERIVRTHHARFLTVESEFVIIEKAGHPTETQQLFEELSPFGILEFVRSGRVAITKPMKEFKTYLAEIEAAAENR